jgi:hypothetical protein
VCYNPLSRYASSRVAAIHLAGNSGGVFFYVLYCIHEEEGASSGFAVDCGRASITLEYFSQQVKNLTSAKLNRINITQKPEVEKCHCYLTPLMNF